MTNHDDYVALASAAIDAMGDDGVVSAHWTETKSRSQATIIVSPSDEARIEKYRIGGNDSIFPRLIIEAPFGRTFKIRGGLYRDACANLDIPRLAGVSFESTLRHTSQLRTRMSELIAVCESSCDFTQMGEKLTQMNEIPVMIADALAELYPIPEDASENTRTRARTRAAAIYSRIHSEQLKLDGKVRTDGISSLWRLTQAITGYVQHDKNRRKGMSDVDRSIMSINDDETAKAWSYASNAMNA